VTAGEDVSASAGMDVKAAIARPAGSKARIMRMVRPFSMWWPGTFGPSHHKRALLTFVPCDESGDLCAG
jgi:hypothetical protein